MIAKALFWAGWVLIALTPIASGFLVNFTVVGGYQSATAWLVGGLSVLIGLLSGLSLLGRAKSVALLADCRDELSRIRYVAEIDQEMGEEEEDYDYPSTETGTP